MDCVWGRDVMFFMPHCFEEMVVGDALTTMQFFSKGVVSPHYCCHGNLKETKDVCS